MTSTEWDKFTTELEATFRGDLEADREAALFEHFGQVPYGLARACIVALVDQGQVMQPAPGELRTALRRVCPAESAYRAALEGITWQAYQARELDTMRERLGLPRGPHAVIEAPGLGA